MGVVMRLSMAAAAALGAIVLSGAAFLGPAAAAAAAAVVICVIAWGWPRQLGAPARLSLTITLAVTGLVGVVLNLVWRAAGFDLHGPLGLFEPMAVVAAWGVMAAFIVQLVRGTGRPLRLESTVGTMGGVMIVVMTSGWVAIAQWNDHPLAHVLLFTLGAAVALCSLVGLMPALQGRPGLLAGIIVPLAFTVALAVTELMGSEPRKIMLACLAAVTASILVALTAATAPSARPRHEDRPIATTARPRRAGFALAMAPVGAAGVIGHVMLAFMG